MTFDVASFRAHFPSLLSGIAHFDGPGGTQTPTAVGQAVATTMTGPLSIRGTSVASDRNAEAVVVAFRAAYADLLGAQAGGIVHGRSATQLTYDLSRVLAKGWGHGDEIVVTQLDHDANVRPWVQAAEHAGATVRWLTVDRATADLDLSTLDNIITERTRLVAVTAASNLLGTRPDVEQIAARAHAVGALVHVDAVHEAAHASVDLAGSGADFLVCSPYKFFGPHSGVLAADPALLETLHPDKLLPSTDDVPERFELGTLPYEVLAGATAAVEFIADLAPAAGSRRERLDVAKGLTQEHELRLRGRIEDGLAELGGAVVAHSVAAERTSTLLYTFPGHDLTDIHRFLAGRDILAPVGGFYAHELVRALDLDGHAGLRIGLAPYNDDHDVDRLLEGITDALGV